MSIKTSCPSVTIGTLCLESVSVLTDKCIVLDCPKHKGYYPEYVFTQTFAPINYQSFSEGCPYYQPIEK